MAAASHPDGAGALIALLARTGEPIAERIEVPRGLLGRVRGLLGRRGIALGTGLLLAPCQGVHTAGMRFPIDLVFLDRHGRAVRVEHEVPPWRFFPYVRRSHRVLELPPGTLAVAGVRVGDLVVLGRPDLHARTAAW